MNKARNSFIVFSIYIQMMFHELKQKQRKKNKLFFRDFVCIVCGLWALTQTKGRWRVESILHNKKPYNKIQSRHTMSSEKHWNW